MRQHHHDNLMSKELKFGFVLKISQSCYTVGSFEKITAFFRRTYTFFCMILCFEFQVQKYQYKQLKNQLFFEQDR